MSRIVTAIGVFMIAMALLTFFAMDRMVSVMEWASRSGQNAAGGARIVIGALLMLAAPGTRYPRGLRVFGGFVVAAGVMVLFVPAETWTGLIEWWLAGDLELWRWPAGIAGLAMGAFFIHAARPKVEVGTPGV